MKKVVLPLLVSGLLLTSCDLINRFLPIQSSETNKEEFEFVNEMFVDVEMVEHVNVDLVENYDDFSVDKVYLVKTAKENIYLYKVRTNGYCPDINLLVGISEDGEYVRKLKVVSHTETSGGTYGAVLLNSPEFAIQFDNLPICDIEQKVDFVAGSTAKITLNAVKSAVEKTSIFHGLKILGKLELPKWLVDSYIETLDIDVNSFVDCTESFMSKLENNLSKNAFERAKKELENFKFVSYAEKTSGAKKKALIIEKSYACEVGSGSRQTQTITIAVIFDENGKNVETKLLYSNDELNDNEKAELSSWISENFTSNSIDELREVEADCINGATFTTATIRDTIRTVIDYYCRTIE